MPTNTPKKFENISKNSKYLLGIHICNNSKKKPSDTKKINNL